MASSTTLAIQIVADASRATAGFNDAESRVDRFNRGLDRASLVAGGVVAGLAGVATQAFNSASALEQSAGAIESVFGAHADAIRSSAEAAATTVGLSQNAYQELASVIGSQLSNVGFAMDEAIANTEGLIGTGADLAATFGGSTQDAVAALSSALRGERDPIERYGISLSQAAVDAEIAAQGLDTSTDASARNSQAVATLALIQRQSASASGAFAREADTAAGAQQRATAQWENASAALGEALLPVVSEAAEKLAGLAGWMSENAGTVQAFAVVIGGLALAVIAVNAAMAVYQAITTVVTAVQWLFNTALLANPLTWLVLLIIAVVAAVVVMYQKFDWFRAFINGAFAVVTAPMRFVWDILGWIWERVGGLGGIVQAFVSVATGAFDLLVSPLEWLWDKLESIGGLLGDLGGVVSDVLGFVFAPAPAPAVTGGAVRGIYGGPAGGGGGALYGAPGGGGGGSLGSSSGGGGSATINVNVELTGAVVDPISSGRELVRILREYGIASGAQVSLGG